jgi:hypothetical protein
VLGIHFHLSFLNIYWGGGYFQELLDDIPDSPIGWIDTKIKKEETYLIIKFCDATVI